MVNPRESISLIIPTYNAGELLERVLISIRDSGQKPFEVLVVDDGSTDETAGVAARWGATVIVSAQRCGPARARNLGAKAARGSILFFIDSDVCIQPDTINRIEEAFQDPTLDALIGSYDDDPASLDFLSQYKNLMHCFVHQSGRSDAATFWSGCGAIRRETFFSLQGFDESFKRPAIEDIELGYRLGQAKRRILLDRDLRVKHLKRWTFWNLVKTDILDRGIPWTELILRDRHMPNDLNIQLSQRVSVALIYVMLGIAAACAMYWEGYFLTPLFAFLFFLLGRYWVSEDASAPVAAPISMAVAAAALIGLSWVYEMKGLIPLVGLSLPVLLLRHRYQPGAAYGWMRVLHWTYFVSAMALIVSYLPQQPLMLGLAAPLFFILFLNRQFYVFLAAKRGRWFAVAAVPFHLLYHLYNGISFAIGLSRFAWRSTARAREPQTSAPLEPR